MIPKRIHYCWFGRGSMPKLAQRCLESWHKHLSDYEFILWNENNFDINSNIYTCEAYKAKKYAFVTDFVRLYALYHYGGIYMDTDVEVLRNFDDLLKLTAFSGFESDTHVPTGIMASEQHGKWVEELLEYYDDLHFIKPDGTTDTTTNVMIISQIMEQGGFTLDNTRRDYKGIATLFPTEYFCPKKLATGERLITVNTYCIHHFAGSWVDHSVIWNNKWKKRIKIFIGPRNTKLIVDLKRKYLK